MALFEDLPQAQLPIADCFRSFELGFTAFRIANQIILTEKNFDYKENRKLRTHFAFI